MKNSKLSVFIGGLIFATACFTACSTQTSTDLTVSGLNPMAFDTVINEKPVKLYTIKNANGMEVSITNFGGRTVAIVVPDKDGNPTDVVLGYDNVAQYADSVNSPSDFGAAIGRYANRINKGQLTIAGNHIQLPTNNFGHCLHGGPSGWQYQVYDAAQPNDSTLELTMNSGDGDNNFPGNVKAVVTYIVKSDNSLDITYKATTDKETVINMTNHSYFNLNGDPTKNVENCLLYINADNYTPSDSTYMTTGEIATVEDTPMDFRTPTAIGDNVNNFDFEQIKNANGYDHNW
ncbi:MAG: galactose mutarotase, partial [Prevotella sp.]|nr:galactose mutarotase [Prevotella sp.]